MNSQPWQSEYASQGSSIIFQNSNMARTTFPVGILGSAEQNLSRIQLNFSMAPNSTDNTGFDDTVMMQQLRQFLTQNMAPNSGNNLRFDDLIFVQQFTQFLAQHISQEQFGDGDLQPLFVDHTQNSPTDVYYLDQDPGSYGGATSAPLALAGPGMSLGNVFWNQTAAEIPLLSDMARNQGVNEDYPEFGTGNPAMGISTNWNNFGTDTDFNLAEYTPQMTTNNNEYGIFAYETSTALPAEDYSQEAAVLGEYLQYFESPFPELELSEDGSDFDYPENGMDLTVDGNEFRTEYDDPVAYSEMPIGETERIEEALDLSMSGFENQLASQGNGLVILPGPEPSTSGTQMGLGLDASLSAGSIKIKCSICGVMIQYEGNPEVAFWLNEGLKNSRIYVRE